MLKNQEAKRKISAKIKIEAERKVKKRGYTFNRIKNKIHKF
jgi:hypothetical protein